MGSFIAGNLGLAKTYWIFCVIGIAIVRFITTFIIMSGANPIIAIVMGFGYSIIVWIAAWNSATNYEGLKLWAILAKISIVFGILGSLAKISVVFGRLGSLAQFNQGDYEMQLHMLAIFVILTVVAFGLWKAIDKFIKIKLIVLILKIFIMTYYLGSIIMLSKVIGVF